jgi:phosphoglycolate phosphatase
VKEVPSHPFKLILFDFDGTLVDSQTLIGTAMSEAFACCGLTPPPLSEVRRVVGLRLEEAVERLVPPQARQVSVEALAAAYRDAFFRLRCDPDHLEPVYPGVPEVLTDLDRPEVFLGIATGKSRRGLTASLERHGLAHHFVILKTADDGPGKPHPAIVEQAMEEMGVAPAETLLVGDTIYDMEMAVAAGVRAIGAAWGYHEVEELLAAGAYRVLTRIGELPVAMGDLE